MSNPSIAKQHRIQSSAEKLSKETHFTAEEGKVLLYIYEKLTTYGPLDRLMMREILHIIFQITDDVMLDLTYKAFDLDNDGMVSDLEWVKGLSPMLRGDIEEQITFVYNVYDINGDGSLAREELSHCLKGCVYTGYSIDVDDIEESERDIVEICMKKLDVDHDGQITFPDFRSAVLMDGLLLQAIGPCLPGAQASAVFLSLVTYKYRKYTPEFSRQWGRSKHSHHSNKSFLTSQWRLSQPFIRQSMQVDSSTPIMN